MSNEFSNNPFASLQGKVQPKRKKIKQIVPVVKVVKPENKINAQSDDFDESDLFLQAVQNTKQTTQTKPRLSATLPPNEDLAKLSSQLDKKKKNKSKVAPNKQEDIPIKKEIILDDDQAFMKAMQEVAPLNVSGRDVAPEVSLANSAYAQELSYEKLMESNVEFSLALKGEYLEGYVLGLDENIMQSLRSGQYSPEAHVDLHGLNAMQAYQALVGFFRGAWYKGLRSVLVVPGRGKNSLNGYGVLRDKLQTWLTQEPFKRVVLAFCTARPVDGGPGSVYVLLRKYKKKGKIQWERMPSDPDLF